MQAGGDFIKTSTGKVSPAATLPVTLVMLEAIRDYFFATGIRIGMKPAGGIRTSKQALAYLVMVKETLGDDWLTLARRCFRRCICPQDSMATSWKRSGAAPAPKAARSWNSTRCFPI
jgi:hypothetical protein